MPDREALREIERLLARATDSASPVTFVWRALDRVRALLAESQETGILGTLKNPPDDLILAFVRSSFDPHINGPNTVQRQTAINDMAAIARWFETVADAR